MKKSLLGFLAVAALTAGCLTLTGCGKKAAELKVGATPVPHAELLNFVKPMLEKDGVKLVVVEFSDYVKPNLALNDKELDANYFQHVPYLESFCKDRKLDLVSAGNVHIEPMGTYSKTIKNIADVPVGAKVSIPNDPTNGGRALNLLAKAGLIKLKDGAGIGAVVGDVVDNPKGIKIVEVEAALLPRSLEDVTLSVINCNYALEAKLNPVKDSLFTEGGESPYANLVAVRKGDEKREDIVKLMKALQSQEVKKHILEKYKGAVVPAF